MKQRLDVLLVEGGFAPSRERAKTMLMAGMVYVNGNKEDKPGSTFDPEKIAIEVKGDTLRYVSRGGLKLEKALQVFPIDLRAKICMDIGASTGGFTDCMLQNGAAYVYAIDVGYGQLDWKLRSDPRVCCMEKTNFRYLKPEELPPVPEEIRAKASQAASQQASALSARAQTTAQTDADPSAGSEQTAGQAASPQFASVDVSFISLSKILPAAAAILPVGSEMVCLIKPQFEAGREKVGKKGVVRDPAVHREVIEASFGYARQTGFAVLGLDFSPIRGPEGNIEYLMHIRREESAGDGQSFWETAISQVVEASHAALEHRA